MMFAASADELRGESKPASGGESETSSGGRKPRSYDVTCLGVDGANLDEPCSFACSGRKFIPMMYDGGSNIHIVKPKHLTPSCTTLTSNSRTIGGIDKGTRTRVSGDVAAPLLLPLEDGCSFPETLPMLVSEGARHSIIAGQKLETDNGWVQLPTPADCLFNYRTGARIPLVRANGQFWVGSRSGSDHRSPKLRRR